MFAAEKLSLLALEECRGIYLFVYFHVFMFNAYLYESIIQNWSRNIIKSQFLEGEGVKPKDKNTYVTLLDHARV